LPEPPAAELTPETTPRRPEAGEVLLAVDGITKEFPVGAGGFLRSRPRSVLHAIDGVDLVVRRGEAIGLVGESGCGKSTLARVALGIHRATSGRVSYRGADLTTASGRELREYRRHVQLVFQDPYSSLNPRATIGAMLREPIVVHDLASGAAVGERVRQLLEMVGLDPAVESRYPHEFSGGQRQRIAIARALAVDPQVIVCDEAVSALDVSLQAQILNLLADLRARLGLAYVFIGHDLATVRYISDRIAVMYLGQIVEEGPADTLVANPRHPYTASLLSAAPEPDPAVERNRERIVLTGDVPSPLDPPPGCRFHTRCPIGPRVRSERRICIEQRPELTDSGNGHRVACHFPGELRRAGLEAAAAGVNDNALVRADGGAA
jgi:oligopeptide/dipeptide ABC transporter ATP-binding protein